MGYAQGLNRPDNEPWVVRHQAAPLSAILLIRPKTGETRSLGHFAGL